MAPGIQPEREIVIVILKLMPICLKKLCDANQFLAQFFYTRIFTIVGLSYNITLGPSVSKMPSSYSRITLGYELIFYGIIP